MSRLRKGVHTVTVTPVQPSAGPYGPEEPATHVMVRCNVQPVSSKEAAGLAEGVQTVYRVKYFHQEHGQAPWPGGPYSRIEWDGRVFEQRGEAILSSMSATTSHYKVLIVDPSAEVK